MEKFKSIWAVLSSRHSIFFSAPDIFWYMYNYPTYYTALIIDLKTWMWHKTFFVELRTFRGTHLIRSTSQLFALLYIMIVAQRFPGATIQNHYRRQQHYNEPRTRCKCHRIGIDTVASLRTKHWVSLDNNKTETDKTGVIYEIWRYQHAQGAFHCFSHWNSNSGLTRNGEDSNTTKPIKLFSSRITAVVGADFRRMNYVFVLGRYCA